IHRHRDHVWFEMAPSHCLYSAVSSNSSKSLFPHILTLCSSSASIRLPLRHAWTTGALLVSLGQLDNANLTYAMYPVCMATSYFTQYSTLQLGDVTSRNIDIYPDSNIWTLDTFPDLRYILTNTSDYL